MGVFVDGKYQGHPFWPPKIKQNNKTSALVQERLARNCLEQWMFGLQWTCKYSS